MQEANATYAQLRDAWIKTGDSAQLLAFVETEDYHQMSYVEQNRGFVTASKLRCFAEDEWTYKLKYHDELRSPYERDNGSKPLSIGSAFDEKITYDMDAFDRHFVVLERTVSDIDEEILQCEQKLQECVQDVKKNGERSMPSVKKENDLQLKISQLMSLRGKTQITVSDYKLVLQMEEEWKNQPLFRKPVKKTVFFKIGRIPCKAELDDYNPHFTDETVGAADFHAVLDAKTCENILTFKPEGYLDQMSWYQLALLEAEALTDARPVCAVIEAVDKHFGWSRSCGYYFSPERLHDRRGYLIGTAVRLWEAEETDFFVRGNEFKPESPFYGHEGYGRAPSLIPV